MLFIFMSRGGVKGNDSAQILSLPLNREGHAMTHKRRWGKDLVVTFYNMKLSFHCNFFFKL